MKRFIALCSAAVVAPLSAIAGGLADSIVETAPAAPIVAPVTSSAAGGLSQWALYGGAALLLLIVANSTIRNKIF